MGLNGIDISSWQDDLVVSNMTTCDFVIVKATGGAGYKNECFERHANDTLSSDKLLGCYHYARDRGYEGSATEEADHFIAAFRPYVGKAIPFLDWEADALGLGVAWAKSWLDRVKAKTGVTPGIYTSKSVCFAYDWSSVAKTYPLWVAQYPDYEDTGFRSEPWTDGWDFGAWDSPLIFQYTGTGRIPGYGGHLDLDLFYGTKADWQGRCAVAGTSADEEVEEVNRILSGGSSGGSYDVDALAWRVIAGEFGNGDARKQALGSRYDAVQRRVNEILGAAGTTRTSIDVDAMARAVIRGDYGNGDERKRRLGSYYSIVQARVNEMLS